MHERGIPNGGYAKMEDRMRKAWYQRYDGDEHGFVGELLNWGPGTPRIPDKKHSQNHSVQPKTIEYGGMRIDVKPGQIIVGSKEIIFDGTQK